MNKIGNVAFGSIEIQDIEYREEASIFAPEELQLVATGELYCLGQRICSVGCASRIFYPGWQNLVDKEAFKFYSYPSFTHYALEVIRSLQNETITNPKIMQLLWDHDRKDEQK